MMICELNRLDVDYVNTVPLMQAPRWYYDSDKDIWQTRLNNGRTEVRLIRQTGRWHTNDLPWELSKGWADASSRFAPFIVIRTMPEGTPKWLHTNFRRTIAYLRGE